MSLGIKVTSLALSLAAIVVALAIGGGSPPDLSVMATRSNDAADNLRVANRNLAGAVRDTSALATIVSAVGDQLEASQRLLETQLRIEASTRSSASSTSELAGAIGSVESRLDDLRSELATLTRLARRAGAAAGSSADAADDLQATLRTLRARFGLLIEESRELNRKARGYEELRDGPG